MNIYSYIYLYIHICIYIFLIELFSLGPLYDVTLTTILSDGKTTVQFPPPATGLDSMTLACGNYFFVPFNWAPLAGFQGLYTYIRHDINIR